MTDDDKASAEIAVGPQGASGKLSGFKVAELALAILLMVCTTLVIWQIHEKENARKEDTAKFIEMHKTTHALLGAVNKNQLLTIEAVKNSFTVNEDGISTLVYVMTRTPAELATIRLDLTMPPALRRQLNQR
jgi:hypothetical protein